MFSCCAARLSSSQAHVRTIEVLACHNSFSASCLDVLVGFIPSIILRRRLSPTTTAILTFRHECHCLGHHLVLAALLAVFRFPPALLQPPIDDDSVPLAEILPAMFRLLAEDDNVDKTNFFLQFIALLVPPADREAQTSHWRSV